MYVSPPDLLANLKTPKEIRLEVARRLRDVRLAQNLRQSDLAERSGVTLASIRRFEREGEISLKHLVNLALTLGRAQDFGRLFEQEAETDLYKPEKPKRRRARS